MALCLIMTCNGNSMEVAMFAKVGHSGSVGQRNKLMKATLWINARNNLVFTSNTPESGRYSQTLLKGLDLGLMGMLDWIIER